MICIPFVKISLRMASLNFKLEKCLTVPLVQSLNFTGKNLQGGGVRIRGNLPIFLICANGSKGEKEECENFKH